MPPETATLGEVEHDALLAETLAEMGALEPDDALEPTLIDEQLENATSLWYIAYSTS